MKVWKKKSTKYVKDGKRVPKGTDGATKTHIESKRFYGTLRKRDGKTKQVPLTEDAETSLELLRKLQTDEDRKNALGISEADEARTLPLVELITQYEAELRSRGNTDFHVDRTIDCIRLLVSGTKATTVSDLNASAVAHLLAKWRNEGKPTKSKGQRKTKPLSVGRTNVYLTAIKGFSRWLHEHRDAPKDALASLKRLNTEADRRMERRALTPAEFAKLIEATESGNRYGKMRPADRAMLYVLATYTGLRSAELASLTKASFDLEAKTVTVDAAYSKRRRRDVLPLHEAIIERLTAWLLTKEAGSVFPGRWVQDRRQTEILKHDLANAGIAYEDEHGRKLSFHALRHTFITSLANAGVHPNRAKELARHSTITLTMDVYAHVETEELRAEIAKLPPLTHQPPASGQAE